MDVTSGRDDRTGDATDERRRALTRRRRLLEAYMAAVPLSFAVAFAVNFFVRPAVPLLFGAAIALVLLGSVLVPVLLFVDASETSATVPVRRLLAAGVVLPLPTLAYYFRSDPAPTPPGRVAANAGYLVAAAIPGWLAFFAGDIVALYGRLSGTGVSLRGTAVLVPGAAGLLLFGAFPFAVYADAKYVRAAGSGWAPSPSLRYLGALAFYSPLALVLPAYVCYHLYRRRRALDRGRR